jgi:hypothetical protein
VSTTEEPEQAHLPDEYGAKVIAVPHDYYDEFRRDVRDSLLKYGALPQRGKSPFFVDVPSIEAALTLPDQITGPRSMPIEAKQMIDKVTGASLARQLVAEPTARALMDGINPDFRSYDQSYWHVHIDASLRTKGFGDATGFAMGRISHTEIERDSDPTQDRYQRVIRTFDVPLATRIVSPPGGQISIGGIIEFILRLRQERGFNITSVSMDNFQSALALQEFAAAGIVVPGLVVDDDTGEITGNPKAFSVDGRSVQQYRDFRELVTGHRIRLPRYMWLRKEMLELEDLGAQYAPDHPLGGGDTSSKDVCDGVAGVVGYLSANGHAKLQMPGQGQVITGEDMGLGGYASPGDFDDDDEGVDFSLE